LADGAKEVKMHGEMVPVRAEIEQIESFSVHADADELIAWIKPAASTTAHVFVVHGEAGASETLVDRLKSELSMKAHAPIDREIAKL
jgi:metallo-beta-lactamase family protein